MKSKLFSLKVGQVFRFGDKNEKYELIEYKKKYMPTLGRIFNAVCKGEDGKICKFIRNWEVEV